MTSSLHAHLTTVNAFSDNHSFTFFAAIAITAVLPEPETPWTTSGLRLFPFM